MLNVIIEQNERLTSFADIVTHNLRAHLGNLATITEFLEEDFSGICETENYKLLKIAVENLKETVSHLTQVAKNKEIDPLEMEALSLYAYVQKAMYNIIALAQNANAIIYNEIDEGLKVRGIAAYLDSIVLNFFTNAIKYKSNERISIIELTSEVLDGFVIFKIKDNGLGIDMEKFGDKIFQMYKTFHYDEDAIGIGLFITKNHIESPGGRVEVQSEVGKGTEFKIYLKKA
jgi:signal transduction histidine kinase